MSENSALPCPPDLSAVNVRVRDPGAAVPAEHIKNMLIALVHPAQLRVGLEVGIGDERPHVLGIARREMDTDQGARRRGTHKRALNAETEDE